MKIQNVNLCRWIRRRFVSIGLISGFLIGTHLDQDKLIAFSFAPFYSYGDKIQMYIIYSFAWYFLRPYSVFGYSLRISLKMSFSDILPYTVVRPLSIHLRLGIKLLIPWSLFGMHFMYTDNFIKSFWTTVLLDFCDKPNVSP